VRKETASVLAHHRNSIDMNTQTNFITRDRLAGGLYGLLVGDALGVPYEFHPPQDIPAQHEIEFMPPPDFHRAHIGTPPGTWSDDGAQALVLLDSLLARGGLDLDHFAAGLVRWEAEGFFAVDGRVFDIGIQTSNALGRLRSGTPPETAGPSGERENGNGSLMRVLPLALWHRGDERALVADAMRQSLPTHGHLRSQLCCALYCLWARAELQGRSDAWNWASEHLRALADPKWAQELDHILDPKQAREARGSGYVLDTLWSAKACLDATGDFESAVRHAIALGHDTDTTAAVAGGLAGIRYGRFGIPQRWVEGLRGTDLLGPVVHRLLEHAVPRPPKHAGSARTSETHPLQIATLELGIKPGRIGITFCPGKKQDDAITGAWDRDLRADLERIRDWGARHVLTLIEPWEIEALQVQALPEVCAELGMTWHHAPIRDGSVPDEHWETRWPTVEPALLAALEDGHGVLVHCKGGLGRAGSIACRLAIAAGDASTAEALIGRVRAVRPGAVETRAQELAIHSWVRPSS
jgi:ADP-ribosylglycohydrolase/protein-tyrosine phosphatase